MDTETSSTSRAARKLADLLASVEVNADWPAVEFNAQTLANGLRTRRGPGMKIYIVISLIFMSELAMQLTSIQLWARHCFLRPLRLC